MSEANAPFNRPGQSESADSSFSDQPEDFPNPFGEVPEVEAEVVSSHPAHSVTNAPGTENWLNPSESTNLADLISLIQELNQCNTILLDRVSQLEEALERSQNALKAEVKRSQDYTFTGGLTAAQDLAAAQEQAIDLYSQLEFVHQTSQRQQILIETLTGQLETSQERVAELEREAALVQQRCNEQAQLLVQSENNCRDLQARLHRQQRYTLQFKVALEKSLDVSTSTYEPVSEVLGISNPSERSFLPKVQHIKPWTSPDEISPARFPWMKLSSEPLPNEPIAPQVSAPSTPQSTTDLPFDPANLPGAKSRRSKLASVKLPGFSAVDATGSPTHAGAHQSAPAPVDLSAIPDEKLMQKLDSMVQPLADLLAEAVLTEVNATGSSEVGSAAADSMPNRTPTAPTPHLAEPPVEASSADDLLNSVMAEAEDALWQDLARLIDVSTEDVVKASLSGDISAFESIDFEALQTAQTPPAPEFLTGSPQPSRSPQTEPIAPTIVPPASTDATFFAALDEPIANDPESAHSTDPVHSPSVFGATPGWPAPLIYPTRPAKKRRSLAAVDLPSFLQPGPLPT